MGKAIYNGDISVYELITAIGESMKNIPGKQTKNIRGILHRWRSQYTPDGNKTRMAEQQDELNQLRCRIAELEEENGIRPINIGIL